MITIFNRKELLVTMDMKVQSEARMLLAQNHIDYDIKTTNLQSAPVYGASRARTGSFGVNPNFMYEYKIYVHKKDYEIARALVRF